MKKVNPIGWSDGNFPIVLLNVFKAENIWLNDGDLIYSAFKVDGKYYASGVKEAANGMCFIMAFGNVGSNKVQLSEADYISINGFDDRIPVKVGFDANEPIYWALLREGVIYQLDLISESVGNYGKQAKFEVTNNVIEILDNPYYSLNPVWPEITELKVKVPTTTKALTFSQFMSFRTLMPKWTNGYFVPEIVEGSAKLRVNKYFNACTIRFTKTDVEKGFILLKIKATTLKNSYSENTSKTYKIYWK